MKLREVTFWYWLAERLPKKLLYFAVMHVWARATTEMYRDKAPDEVTLFMAVKVLGVTKS